MGRSKSSVHTGIMIFAIALLSLVGYLIFADSGNEIIPVLDSKMRGVTDAIVGSGNEGCGTLVRECIATASVKVPECDESSAHRRIADAVGVPIDNEGCTAVARELVVSCPAGCRFDFQGLVTVPGTMKMSLSSEPDEAGYCHAEGKLPITLRGTCLKE